MAVSTNLGLYLPTREDYISVSRDLSNNYEIIDESAGMLEKGIAIVVDGDTVPRAITSGQYLFIKNHSSLATGGYHATANIANGATITSSNVSADSAGVVNAAYASLSSDISTLNSKFATLTGNVTGGTYGTMADYNLSYPTGFNNSNSHIVGFGFSTGTPVRYGINPLNVSERVFVRADSTYIILSSNLATTYYEITLMKN